MTDFQEFPEDMPPMHRIAILCLGGSAPKAGKGSRTKTGRLAAVNWRIIPIPTFWAACQLFHDGKGNGNPAYVDFERPREWLVVPPETVPLRARKFNNRRHAIAWAWGEAMGDAET